MSEAKMKLLETSTSLLTNRAGQDICLLTAAQLTSSGDLKEFREDTECWVIMSHRSNITDTGSLELSANRSSMNGLRKYSTVLREYNSYCLPQFERCLST